jgi:FkbM family methyltransferase
MLNLKLHNLKRRFRKKYYYHFYFLLGYFRYFGTKVYFPKDSLLFKMASDQGIYEEENIKLLLLLIQPDSYYFDVGANIGLMSIPILRSKPTCAVLSFEPSPNAAPFLMKTIMRSDFAGRWKHVEKAAGPQHGSMEFSVLHESIGAFDGFKNTNRMKSNVRIIDVPVTTIDSEWEQLDRPRVSVIKIDVEGAESLVLEGATCCISENRPFILIEWNLANLTAYNVDSEEILNYARKLSYCVYSLPSLAPINDVDVLIDHMKKSENFLLGPKDKSVNMGD